MGVFDCTGSPTNAASWLSSSSAALLVPQHSTLNLATYRQFQQQQATAYKWLYTINVEAMARWFVPQVQCYVQAYMFSVVNHQLIHRHSTHFICSTHSVYIYFSSGRSCSYSLRNVLHFAYILLWQWWELQLQQCWFSWWWLVYSLQSSGTSGGQL